MPVALWPASVVADNFLDARGVYNSYPSYYSDSSIGLAVETELCILSEARNWRQKCIFYIRQNVCTYLELRMNLPGTERNAKRIGNFRNSLKFRLVAGRKCVIKACPAQAGISGWVMPLALVTSPNASRKESRRFSIQAENGSVSWMVLQVYSVGNRSQE